MRPWRRLGRTGPSAAAAGLLLGLAGGAAAQTGGGAEPGVRLRDFLTDLRARPGGALGLMGYNMSPDGSANALQVSRGTRTAGAEEASPTLTLTQFGAGFTLSRSFPLFLEGYAGGARYDPRSLFTGQGARQLPTRWNNAAVTVGVGWDIPLAENLYLRPILNLAVGYAASDASLFGSFLEFRTGRDLTPLSSRHMNVWARGGSLVLAWYDHRPAREIDMELRYTHLRLETFGDTFPAARGSATAQTIGWWGRLRWPTGWEAFGRPVRWVLDGTVTGYVGDQRDAVGFAWAVKAGGGIELDVGRYEVGAFGLSVSRVRLIGRYFIGDRNVTGASIGIGVSF